MLDSKIIVDIESLHNEVINKLRFPDPKGDQNKYYLDDTKAEQNLLNIRMRKRNFKTLDSVGSCI